MIQEFKELREAFCDDYRSSMKDLANFSGGIGHRLAEKIALVALLFDWFSLQI